MFGLLNIYKPKGITSHDVVAVVRKILGIKQVGHTGTLDPFAEGVLVVCVGKATRLTDYFEQDKAYLATVRFGADTDTYDIEGNIVKSYNKKITETEIKEALKDFTGEIEQLPPIYSAIKVDGKKLYEYARNGETVEIKPRKVNIYNINLINFDEKTQTAKISVECSKGTYIRSIAFDLGQKLNCGGYLTELIRTKAGKFEVEQSVQLPVLFGDENKKYLINDGAKEILQKAIENPLKALSLPVFELQETDFEKIKHGNSIKFNNNDLKSGDFLILVYNNHVAAVGEYGGDIVKVKKVFV